MESIEKKDSEKANIIAVKKEQVNQKQMVIVRIAGQARIKKTFVDTLRMLNLSKKHMCTIVPANDVTLGMIQKVKDCITWGEVTPETVALLEQKRGEKTKEGTLKPFFRLHPPKGGYERKGTKVSFTAGGALGYRGEKINDLVKKMI